MKVNFVDLITMEKNEKCKIMWSSSAYKVGEKLCIHVYVVIKIFYHAVFIISYCSGSAYACFLTVSIIFTLNKNRLILTAITGDLNI